MKRLYSDIIDKLGEPLWYDGNGCPRYRDFGPDLCDIYISAVVLLEIACQSCRKRFIVATEFSNEEYLEADLPSRYSSKLADELSSVAHYGDPPRHPHENKCMAGESMNSIPLRIIEWWEHTDLDELRWRRRKEFEIDVRDEQDREDGF